MSDLASQESVEQEIFQVAADDQYAVGLVCLQNLTLSLVQVT